MAMTKAGKAYSIFCLDNNAERMSVKILRKIAQLARNGVIICGQIPSRMTSMFDSKDEFDALIKDIWFSERPNVFGGKWLKEVTVAAGISPDWIVLEGKQIRAVHRELADGDIYWVNSPLATSQSAEISLRVSGYRPQKWNPVNGKISDLSYRTDGDRTIVSLDFDPDDAFFIVFREKTSETYCCLPESKCTVITDVPVEGLGCWTENPQTKYFSGTRSYTVTTEVPEYEGRLILDLGQVCNLAQVFVDGQKMGCFGSKGRKNRCQQAQTEYHSQRNG